MEMSHAVFFLQCRNCTLWFEVESSCGANQTDAYCTEAEKPQADELVLEYNEEAKFERVGPMNALFR